MFIKKHAIDSIGSAIESWKKEADSDMIRAKLNKKKSLVIYKEFQDICASLKVMDCPFCGNEMLDTEPLEKFSDQLSRDNIYLYQGEAFTFSCKVCHTYLAEKPDNSFLSWVARDIKNSSKIFATYVFYNYPEVDEVVKGKAGSCPAWFFHINGQWYASDLTIDLLKKHWVI